MRLVADLHIHSRFSRSCSQKLTLPNIAKWCAIKGINLVSTGDFCHPAWFKEISEQLVEDGEGLLGLKDGSSRVKFILGNEVSCIYKDKDKVRRVHLCLFFPTLANVAEFNNRLEAKGCNIRSDGRPILGLPAKEVLKTMLDINPAAMMIPAHAWTPWFAVFGSKSGFDSLEECFEELTPEIFAIETGLSSVPSMNWRLRALDKITLVSNSDAHSLSNLGREANILEMSEFSYKELREIFKNKDRKKFIKTLEFYPEEGMYHYDGHRTCGVVLMPPETKKHNLICPSCRKPLTIGVLHRVSSLADRPENFAPPDAIPFNHIVGLDKIIAEALGVKSRSNPSVQRTYEKLIAAGGNELKILLDIDYADLIKFAPDKVVEGIRRVRENQVKLEAGFDGQYGKVIIFSPKEKDQARQKKLFD